MQTYLTSNSPSFLLYHSLNTRFPVARYLFSRGRIFWNFRRIGKFYYPFDRLDSTLSTESISKGIPGESYSCSTNSKYEYQGNTENSFTGRARKIFYFKFSLKFDRYERVITTFDNSTFIRFSLPRLIVIRHIYANGRAFNDHATFETINCSSVTFNFCVTGTTLSCIYPVSISNLISYLLALFFFNLSSSFSSSSSRFDSFRLIFNRTWFLFYFFFSLHIFNFHNDQIDYLLVRVMRIYRLLIKASGRRDIRYRRCSLPRNNQITAQCKNFRS